MCAYDECEMRILRILAIYSVQLRLQTVTLCCHGSGVTVWEILTFGARPYAGKTTKEVVVAVINGTRLHQPSTCSLDLYKEMLSCEF